MKYLITGGCGFIGSNLAVAVLERGEDLFIFDNLSRTGAVDNLSWLRKQGLNNFICGDVRNREDVDETLRMVRPDVIFHLAGQVAMTTSMSNPRYDFQTNALGTFNLLEAAREYTPDVIFLFSSTNKVYGELEYIKYFDNGIRYICPDYPIGFDEKLPLDFRSPYGCSKGAADQYVIDYGRYFGLRSVVFRHSTVYGGRQFSTYDQGWVGWFIKQALSQKHDSTVKPFTISGDGKQVRDILFSNDLVTCYFDAIKSIDSIAGQVFNIGGGINNSLSLLELFSILEKKFNISLNYIRTPWRASDQKVFVADIRKAKQFFSWAPTVDKHEGINQMIKWMVTSSKKRV